MLLFVTIVHVLLCLALILVILIQPAKDGSALLGGGVNSMYGPRANAHPLGRATTVIAVMFMATSVFLAFKSTQRGDTEVDEEEIRRLQEEKAASQAAPATPTPDEEPAPLEPTPTDEPAAPAEQVPATETPADAPAPEGSAP